MKIFEHAITIFAYHGIAFNLVTYNWIGHNSQVRTHTHIYYIYHSISCHIGPDTYTCGVFHSFLLWSIFIHTLGRGFQNYFIISSEKLKPGWTLTTSQYTIKHFVYFKIQRTHTHTHTHTLWCLNGFICSGMQLTAEQQQKVGIGVGWGWGRGHFALNVPYKNGGSWQRETETERDRQKGRDWGREESEHHGVFLSIHNLDSRFPITFFLPQSIH